MSDDYIKDKLSRDYSEDIINQQKKYLSEKQYRLEREQDEIMREQERIRQEDRLQEENRKKLIQLQYQDYVHGLQEKENKTQKEFEEKLVPQNVSLPMNSEERLRSYHDRIYKLSDKADRNKKIFLDYNERAKNDKYYNYLSKRYVYDNKAPNQTISESKEIPMSQKMIKSNVNMIENKSSSTLDDNKINYYLRNYGNYKDVYKQYDNYNKILAEQNIRNKDYMNKQRTLDELKRIEEREKLYNFEKQEKMYENEKKKEYRESLDRQIKENFPIKLYNENYNEKNFVKNTPFFNDRELYNSSPNFSLVNKSDFVEVNPYNAKNYDLGNSDLENNPILNPMFNYNYNKYLFPRRMNKNFTPNNNDDNLRKNYHYNINEMNPEKMINDSNYMNRNSPMDNNYYENQK